MPSQRIATRLTARHETLACVEIASGGRVSSTLTAAPGSSAYFLGGYILTANSATWPATLVSRAPQLPVGTDDQGQLSALAAIAQQDFGADWGFAIANVSASGHRLLALALRSPTGSVAHAQVELPESEGKPVSEGLVQYVLQYLAGELKHER